VAGVVLAAGIGSRMEAGFKLLLPYGAGTVVEAPVRAALRAGLDPVVVVTGHRGHEVRRALEERSGPQGEEAPGGEAAARGGAAEPPPAGGLRIVFNPRFPEGQAKSLARGILEVRTATEAAAAAVLLGDEPGIRAEAVREVVEAWRRRASARPEQQPRAGAEADGWSGGSPTDSEPATPPVVRARYRDRPGHPVVFPRDVFGELEALEGDRGASSWMERDARRVEEIRIDADAPEDVDTEEDWREVAGEGDAG
jgi:molybdenum cofactor cytidylyltransferase